MAITAVICARPVFIAPACRWRGRSPTVSPPWRIAPEYDGTVLLPKARFRLSLLNG